MPKNKAKPKTNQVSVTQPEVRPPPKDEPEDDGLMGIGNLFEDDDDGPPGHRPNPYPGHAPKPPSKHPTTGNKGADAAAWPQPPVKGTKPQKASGGWPADPPAASGWGPPGGGGWGTDTGAGAWGVSPETGDWGTSNVAGGWGAANEGSAWGPAEPTAWAATNDNSWGAPPASEAHAAPKQSGWKGWSEEAKRNSRVAASTSRQGGAPRGITNQEQQQILNSLLSHPSQKPNTYVNQYHEFGQHTRQGGGGQKPKPNQNKPSADPASQLTKKQMKALKKEQEAATINKHHRGQSESGWGAAGGGWGATGGDWGATGGDWGATGGDWGATGGGWGGGGDRDWDNGGDGWGEGEGGGEGGWGSSSWGAPGGDSGWGPIPEEDEEEDDGWGEDPRRVHFSPPGAGANLWSEKSADTAYTLPSKTLTHAYKGTTTSLEFGIPYNKLNEYTNVQFIESHREALVPVQQALFGKQRLAKDRIHWLFSPNKDERVVTLLAWIQAMSYSIGAFGLHKFLQSRERGALLANADFRPSKNPNEPAFDWLTFDELQATKDKILQESVVFYDPAVEVVVFVFLPSKSGNSVAIWRRKINVPNNTRLMLQAEINLALAGLRRDKDYLVHVDQLPPKLGDKKDGKTTKIVDGRLRRHSSLPPSTAPKNLLAKPKKRKWWRFW